MELFSVLVTGANRGIGLEFVRQLVKLKVPPKHIFATYRNVQSLEELRSIRDECSTTIVHLIKLDVTNSDDLANIGKTIEGIVGEKGLTLLINNAGVAQAQPFPEMTAETMNYHFSVNVIGPVLITQAVYRLLKASASRKNGAALSFSRAAVLNMSSMAGSITNAGIVMKEDVVVPSYKISKAALNMAMRNIACKAKQDGILVSMMCPGWVKTDMGTDQGELELHESIGAMIRTMTKLNEDHSGVYMNRFGENYPF